MLVRIVRMPVGEDHLTTFFLAFDEAKAAIRSFDGCSRLEIYRDRLHHSVVFTISIWASPQHLEGYLRSQLFKKTWKKVRPLFSGKPQAWSLEKLQSVETAT